MAAHPHRAGVAAVGARCTGRRGGADGPAAARRAHRRRPGLPWAGGQPGRPDVRRAPVWRHASGSGEPLRRARGRAVGAARHGSGRGQGVHRPADHRCRHRPDPGAGPGRPAGDPGDLRCPVRDGGHRSRADSSGTRGGDRRPARADRCRRGDGAQRRTAGRDRRLDGAVRGRAAHRRPVGAQPGRSAQRRAAAVPHHTGRRASRRHGRAGEFAGLRFDLPSGGAGLLRRGDQSLRGDLPRGHQRARQPQRVHRHATRHRAAGTAARGFGTAAGPGDRAAARHGGYLGAGSGRARHPAAGVAGPGGHLPEQG